MSRKGVCTTNLEPEPPELMRDYADSHRGAWEYDDFLRRKVEIARKQRDAGLHFSNEEVEADAAARRAELLFRAEEVSPLRRR